MEQLRSELTQVKEVYLKQKKDMVALVMKMREMHKELKTYKMLHGDHVQKTDAEHDDQDDSKKANEVKPTDYADAVC